MILSNSPFGAGRQESFGYMFKLKATELELEEKVSRSTPNFPVLVTTIPGLTPRIPGHASHRNLLARD
jgi:hypothetical protein